MDRKDRIRQRRLQKHKKNRQKHKYPLVPSQANRKYRRILFEGKRELDHD